MIDKIEEKGGGKNIHPVSLSRFNVEFLLIQRAKGSELSLSRNIFVEILIR